MRYALGIEYDGTAYNGWQRQRSGDGVQSHIERAISSVADAATEVVCAGRTDSGVHASGQVIHFDASARRSDRGWMLGVNSNLPDDICVRWARLVPDDFHARFSATARRYRFLILNRLARSALHRNRAWWVHRALDAGRMHAAAQCLLGEHDFSAFRAAGCQAASPVRSIRELTVTRKADWIILDIVANAFLQHMVRNVTGTLVEIGSGDRQPDWLQAVLESRDRKAGGAAAPPHGLTLREVEYPSHYQLPTEVKCSHELV